MKSLIILPLLFLMKTRLGHADETMHQKIPSKDERSQRSAIRDCSFFPTGNYKFFAGKASSLVLSADGSKLATVGDRKLTITDVATGKKQSFDYPFGYIPAKIEFSSDSGSVYMILEEGFHNSALLVANLKTNKQMRIGFSGGWHHQREKEVYFSKEGKHLIYKSLLKQEALNLESLKAAPMSTYVSEDLVFGADVTEDGILTLFERKSGRKIFSSTSDDGWINNVMFSPDSRFFYGEYSKKGTAFVVSTQDGSIREFTKDKLRSELTLFSPDSKYLAIGSYDDTIDIIDLTNGKKQTLTSKNTLRRPLGFSSNSESLYLFDRTRQTTSNDEYASFAGGNVKSVNLKSGVESSFNLGAVSLAKIAPDLSFVVARQGDASEGNVLRVLDSKNGKPIYQFPNSVNDFSIAEGSKHIAMGTPKGTVVMEAALFCAQPDQRYPEKLPDSPELQKTLQDTVCLIQPAEATLRLERLKAKKTLDDKDVYEFLMLLQKPSSFKAERDLPTFLAILEDKEFSSTHPELIRRAMGGILASSGMLFDTLVTKYALSLSPSTSPSEGACIQVVEEQELALKALSHLSTLANADTFSLDSPAFALALSISKSKNAQANPAVQGKKEAVIEQIATRFSDEAADSPEFKSVFHSKLYKFASKVLKNHFNDTNVVTSDITLVREGNKIKPILLSTHTINGDNKTKSPFGFFSHKLPELEIDVKDKAERQIHYPHSTAWETGGHKFDAHLNLTLLAKQEKAKQSDSIPYEGLWKDNALSGLIITGSNLGGSESVIDEYLHYYQSQDPPFEFEDYSPEVDTYKLLQDKISSGEIDYLVKEAHSDGDEKNLFRINNQSKIKKGVRKLADGKKEVVYLVYPVRSDMNTRLIPNGEFATWINERDKRNLDPLVYFNTSCWSSTKAIYELQEANSPNLINIPATNVVYTFQNSSTNAERLLFTAFREGKTYAEMEKALLSNEDYKNGTGNGFIFPNTYKYESLIWDVIARPLRIGIDLKRDGSSYNIDN